MLQAWANFVDAQIEKGNSLATLICRETSAAR